MDNDTMVESFKFLNYCQLAKNSLASKRFRDLIRMHRHKLALLNVDTIAMNWDLNDELEPCIRIFDKDLSPEECNEWIVRNEYSKQIPLECQFAEMEDTEDDREFYELTGRCKVSSKLEHEDNASYATVFYANEKELNHENWPLFEHFIRLLTDPFIYVKSMGLFPRNEILYLLTKAMNPDRNRLQCDDFCCDLEGNAPKFISWIKNHVRCDRLNVPGYCDSNELTYERELLDLFMTGANVCSSKVDVPLMYNLFLKIVYNFVQKFLDLKECDEYQVVKTVELHVLSFYKDSIDELKEKYARFIVKEEPSYKYTFEFVNGNIGKKLQLTTDIELGRYLSCCVLNL